MRPQLVAGGGNGFQPEFETVEVSTNVTYEGITLYPVDAEVSRTRYFEASATTVVGVPRDYAQAPKKDDELLVTINGFAVFTGEVVAVKDMGDGSYEVTAHDAFKDLQETTITETYNSTLVSIAQDVLERAGVSYQIHNDFGQVPAIVQKEYTEARGDWVMKEVARGLVAQVWVDAHNTVHLGRKPHDAEDRDLDYVIDTSVGDQDPPANDVTVTGESPASQLGEKLMHQIKKNGLIANKSDTSGSGKKKHKYHHNKNIRTQTEADNTAEAILKEQLMQKKGGWVKIVGNSEVSPYDHITLPYYFEDEEYFVDGVIHSLNSTNGYTTKIQVAEPVDL